MQPRRAGSRPVVRHARRHPALRQDASRSMPSPSTSGRLHGRADRPGRRRQVQPAGADRRRPRDPGRAGRGARRRHGRRRGIAGAVCPRIAYMPQGLGKNLYPTLSVFENVDFFGRLFGHGRAERERRIAELLRQHRAGAASPTGRPASCPGGMKQKLGLCCALIHDPDLLILDEPTTGVDPLSRRQFWELIDRIRARPAGHERAGGDRLHGGGRAVRLAGGDGRRPGAGHRHAGGAAGAHRDRRRWRRPSSRCCRRRSARGHEAVVVPPRAAERAARSPSRRTDLTSASATSSRSITSASASSAARSSASSAPTAAARPRR